MKLVDAFPNCPRYVNGYVWDSMKSIDDSLSGDYGISFHSSQYQTHHLMVALEE